MCANFITTFVATPISIIRNSMALPVVISAREVFRPPALSTSVAMSIDGPVRSTLISNVLAFDPSLMGSLTWCLNAGTTEHLPNPLAAFFFMHYLCRKGVGCFTTKCRFRMVQPWLNNLTPKFWHTLRWMNSYDVLSAANFEGSTEPNDGGDERKFRRPDLDFIENLTNLEQHSASIQIIFRKAGDRGFIPPYDAVFFFPTNDGGRRC